MVLNDAEIRADGQLEYDPKVADLLFEGTKGE